MAGHRITRIMAAVALLVFMLAPRETRAFEFMNAFMHFNLGVSYGFLTGDIIEEEHRANYYILSTNSYNAEHYDFSYSLTVDIMPIPPFILGNEAHAVKFGLRARYNNNTIRQDLTVRYSSSDQETFGGNLIQYSSWMIGPVVYYSPAVTVSDLSESYSSGGGFTLYVLYGRIISGDLSAWPSNRDTGLSVPSPYDSDITGYRIDAGLGAAISIGFINLGLNMYYSLVAIKLDPNVYQAQTLGSGADQRTYQALPDETFIHEFSIEIYFGIPLVWSRLPFF